MGKGIRWSGAIQWVSTEWLQEHHQDKGLVIVDVQPDVHDYIKAHVPGAAYLPEKSLRSYWHSLPAEWTAPQAAEMLVRRLGLQADAPVVVYTGVGLVKGWGDGLDIPGSVNLPWKSLMEAENPALLKPETEITRLVAEKGATADKTIICSCGTGREATNEFILFKYFLGYPQVKLFEGAFTQWSSYPENAVVTGPNPG